MKMRLLNFVIITLFFTGFKKKNNNNIFVNGVSTKNDNYLIKNESDYINANPTGTLGLTSAVHHHNWKRFEYMDTNGLYILEWWIKSNNKEIYFKITANTQGFIGLGFSHKSTTMADTDLILIWVDDRNGKPHVLDCHGPQNGNGAPIQDDTQNYDVIDGFQNSTHTQVIFSRQLETCDPHDLPITADTIKVLWSFGQNDPTLDGSNIKGHHGLNRGVKSLHLMGPMFRKPSSTHHYDIRKWDVTVNNVTIDSNIDTLYWCKIMKAPTLQDKHHIIGYEGLLTRESSTNKPLVHHMTLFECSLVTYPGSDPSSWDVWVKSNGAICNSNLLTPRDWDSCRTPVATWSVGSTGQFLPAHVGIPIGGKTGPKYYMLEIHYDNPKAKKLNDHSGFRIHYTRHLRKHDCGIMSTGISVSETLLIPPGQKLYRNIGICAPTCTSRMFPDDGIKIISATLHSHQAGRNMKLRHLRNGKELKRIIEDNNYDYNYQQVRQLENETIILPGDYMIVDCAYETLDRKRPTLGGYSTKQEICTSFLTYYPKIDLTGCYSMTPVREFFETFGVYQFYSLNMTDVENLFLYNGNILDLLPTALLASKANGKERDEFHENSIVTPIFTDKEDILYKESLLNKLVISDPVEFHDKTFLSHLNQLPWSEPLFTRRVEQALITGKHMTFCRISNESVSIPSEIVRFPNFIGYAKVQSVCPYNLLVNSQISSSASALKSTSSSSSFININKRIVHWLIFFYKLSHTIILIPVFLTISCHNYT